MESKPFPIRNIVHYALWLFMFFFVFDYHFFEANLGEAILFTLREVAVYMVIFYVNLKMAIPFLLAKNKKWEYVISIGAFLFIYIFFLKISGLEYQFYEMGYWRNIFSMTVNFVLFWMISTLIWYSQKWQQERELQLQLRAEKLVTEMKFLKNQISPHFIFNTLNNIYSLVQQKHENAAPMLAKLSKILRYLLYESAQQEVLLEKELEAIQHYIELQLLRKPKSNNVDFYKEGRVQYLKIAPLLLVNFVENAFKHSQIDQSEEAWIQISCIIKEDKTLHFSVENSKVGKAIKEDNGGLGNENVKRQLALSYPEKHTLHITEEENAYKLDLQIQLT